MSLKDDYEINTGLPPDPKKTTISSDAYAVCDFIEKLIAELKESARRIK